MCVMRKKISVFQISLPQNKLVSEFLFSCTFLKSHRFLPVSLTFLHIQIMGVSFASQILVVMAFHDQQNYKTRRLVLVHLLERLTDQHEAGPLGLASGDSVFNL